MSKSKKKKKKIGNEDICLGLKEKHLEMCVNGRYKVN